MNIFVVDNDPVLAANMLPDRLVCKMPVESSQILCTVLRKLGLDAHYKITHPNHPATKWAGLSKGNMQWLKEHGLALCKEYTRRYGRRHACQDIIESIEIPEFLPEEKTPFAQCMPNEYKRENAIEAYRKYMIKEKSYYAKWKLGNKPEWWNQND